MFKGNMFYCSMDKNFINMAYLCDGKFDCKSGFDEKNCETNDKKLFECAENGIMINVLLVCNYIEDCPDGSDERNCG